MIIIECVINYLSFQGCSFKELTSLEYFNSVADSWRVNYLMPGILERAFF